MESDKQNHKLYRLRLRETHHKFSGHKPLILPGGQYHQYPVFLPLEPFDSQENPLGFCL